MSINVGATVSNPTVLTPSPKVKTLSAISATVVGITNDALAVSVSSPTLQTATFAAQVNEDSILRPGVAGKSLSGISPFVDYTPVQGDITVDVETQSLSLSASAPTVQSASDLTWDWDIPSLQDETDFYTNVMGWTIPSGEPSFESDWIPSQNYTFGDFHNSTEGDVLWAWNQQYKRYGNVSVANGSTTQDWNDDLTSYFIGNLLSEMDADDNLGNSGYGYDHMMGQGLAVVYNDTGNSLILPVLSGLRSRITGTSEYQTLASGGTMNMATWEGRGPGRWAIVTAYATQATGDPAWVTVRDNLIRAYETSTDWEEGGVIQNGGGMYFTSRANVNFLSGTGGTAAYDAGRRLHGTWSMALLAEGMWRFYVQTGNSTLREKLIKMARYIEHYGHDPSWLYPNCGTRIGHEGDGSRWYSSPGDGTLNNAAKNPSYDSSLVNMLVIGYKLTGDTDLLDRARIHFARCNRYEEGSPYALQAASINHLHKYADTQNNPGNDEFDWNKGVLQYTYMIFENGGNPSVVGSGSSPSWYEPLSQYEAHSFPSSTHNANLGQYPGTSGSSDGDSNLYTYSGGVLNTTGLYEENSSTFTPGTFLCLHGGGHNDYNGNEIAAFGPFTSDSPDWLWACPANPAAANTVSNGDQPAAPHSYAYLEYLPSENRLFVPMVNNAYGSSTPTFSESFAFDFDQPNPGSNISAAWLRSEIDDIPGGGSQLGGSFGCYDSAADEYWVFKGRGPTILCKYDVQANSWTRYPSSGTYATLSYSDRQVCAIDPVTKVIMMVTANQDDTDLRCVDARGTPSGVYKPSGSNQPSGSGGLLFDPANRQWVYYAGGSTMLVCPVPANPYSGGDSFNFTSVTVTGDSVSGYESKSGYGGGVWNRFRYCPNPQGYVFSGGWGQNVAFIRA